MSSWRARLALLGLLVLGACEHRPAERQATTTSGGDERARELEAQHEERPAGSSGAVSGEATGYRVDLEATEDVTAGRRVVTEEEAPPAPADVPVEATESPSPPSPSYDDSMSLSVQSMGTSSGSSATTIDLPNIGLPSAREPSPIELVGYAIAPSVPTRVLLGTLELPPGERFVPPVSSCQDTLLYVSAGTLDASGTGIASVDAPATLYAGDAVRFGPEGDGLVVNTSSEPVRTIVALARSEDGGPARVAVDERGDRVLCPDHGASDPLSRPQRAASFATSPPLVVMDGALEVRILLDADAAGAEHAGLAVLTGASSFAVPEHVHDAAAEILYFEEGRGTMHVGDHDVQVAPGVTVYVAEGTPHSFEPSGAQGMRALQFYAPSGPEQRFRGMAAE